MVPWELFVDGLWSGAFAGGLGVVLTAPPCYLPTIIFCGFAGRVARDLMVNVGPSQNWATAMAAALVVLLAVTIHRGREASPVVLVSSILPLGASVAVFHTIVGLFRVSNFEGEALDRAAIALSASLGKAFTTTLAIAVGLAVGIAIARRKL